MVNHPNRSKAKTIEPNETFAQAARDAGAAVTVLWSVRGTPGTVTWITSYAVDSSIAVVLTYTPTAWEVFTPAPSLDIATCIADALERCGVKPVPVPEIPQAPVTTTTTPAPAIRRLPTPKGKSGPFVAGWWSMEGGYDITGNPYKEPNHAKEWVKGFKARTKLEANTVTTEPDQA